VLPFLRYEQCISLIHIATWSEDATDAAIGEACALGAPTPGEHYLSSFASAAHIFHRIRRYEAKRAEGVALNSAELKEIGEATRAFYARHAKEAEFLVDDMKIKFAAIADSDKDRNRIFCEVAKYPTPQYDFAYYANRLVKERGIKCD
jgi:hypothetical protein